MNDYSMNLDEDVLVHGTAHYSKNWNKAKQDKYNAEYYQTHKWKWGVEGADRPLSDKEKADIAKKHGYKSYAEYFKATLQKNLKAEKDKNAKELAAAKDKKKAKEASLLAKKNTKKTTTEDSTKKKKTTSTASTSKKSSTTDSDDDKKKKSSGKKSSGSSKKSSGSSKKSSSSGSSSKKSSSSGIKGGTGKSSSGSSSSSKKSSSGSSKSSSGSSKSSGSSSKSSSSGSSSKSSGSSSVSYGSTAPNLFANRYSYSKDDPDFDESNLNDKTKLGNTSYHGFVGHNGKSVIVAGDSKWIIPDNKSIDNEMIHNLEQLDADLKEKTSRGEKYNSYLFNAAMSLAIQGDMDGVKKLLNQNESDEVKHAIDLGADYIAHGETGDEEESRDGVFYGIPEEKKFPLDSRQHVASAIRFFNWAKPQYRAELAKRITSKIKEYGMRPSPSKINAFFNYYHPEK